MSRRQQRAWQIDWAGPHGTAWGTVNACLTSLSTATVGRFVQTRWPLTESAMLVFVAALTVVGVVMVLARAALKPSATPPATALYKVSCWVGAGGWLAAMYTADVWSWKWFTAMVGLLAALAILAGLIASFATADPPQEGDEPVDERPVSKDPEQRARDLKAIEWEKRLDKLCGLKGTHVPGIEPWEKGNGYTVEAIVPQGGATWKTIDQKADDIGGDLDLKVGCRLSVQMGESRRTALIDVMDVSTLEQEKPYPRDYSPLSILEPLPVGVRDDDTEIGPDLRQKCMLLVGETGSGKTNAGHDVGVGVARCDDALRWDLDFTGGTFLDILEPYMRGRTRQPAVDWAAWDEREALWMTRAAMRGHLARKTGYRDLMREANDDKVPVSNKLPAVIILADEIKRITGAPSEFPDINKNLADLIFEGRSAAFRTVLLGLRATADVVGTDIQAQCHVIAVMRAKDDAEYAWAFGWHSGATVEDAPYPGCGFISLESGAKPVPMKWRRLRPNQLMEVAVAMDGRQPEMDELTLLALDGRNADGSPMPGLMKDELDCYSTRWERFRRRFGGDHPSQPAAPQPTSQATEGEQASAPSGGVAVDQAASPQQAVADLSRTMADLDRVVAEANARNRGHAADVDPDAEKVRDEFDAILAAEGFGADVDWGDPDNWANLPESEPHPDDEAKLLDLIASYGPEGVQPKVLRAELDARHGIKISRDTLHERLKALKAAGRLHQPGWGKWAKVQG